MNFENRKIEGLKWFSNNDVISLPSINPTSPALKILDDDYGEDAGKLWAVFDEFENSGKTGSYKNQSSFHNL